MQEVYCNCVSIADTGPEKSVGSSCKYTHLSQTWTCGAPIVYSSDRIAYSGDKVLSSDLKNQRFNRLLRSDIRLS
nr:hypothetical protein CFP56_53364 [Quercus suber]